MSGVTASRLLVDAGQTGTRLRVIGADGHVVDTVAGPVDTSHDVVEQVADRVRETLSNGDYRIDEVAVGLSGLTDGAARPDALRHRLAHFGVGRVILAHDSVTAYLAANGTHHGVVVAAGTGVVTLGVGPEGVARVDGWGHLLGDAGSAYWIGRSGLEAAMRAFDGRAEPSALMRAAIDEFGPLPDLYMVLQADPARVSRIAGFARTVDSLTGNNRTGDAAATAILAAAGAELAESAAAALVRTGPRTGEGARVSWTGTVLTHSKRVRRSFLDRLAENASDAVVGPPLGEPIDGVGQLFDLEPDHPLFSQVTRT